MSLASKSLSATRQPVPLAPWKVQGRPRRCSLHDGQPCSTAGATEATMS